MSDHVKIGQLNTHGGTVFVFVKPDGAVRISLSNGMKEIPPLSSHAAEQLAALVAKAAAAAPKLLALHQDYEARQGAILAELQNGIAETVGGAA